MSLGTEPLRCEIHRRKESSDAAGDEASARRSEPERSVRLAKSTQGLSHEMGQSAGRSTHDESVFHMAERIPESTKRERGVSVEKVDSRRGTDNRLGTASRGSNRDVAFSDCHELRHDDDRVSHVTNRAGTSSSEPNIPWSRECSCAKSHRACDS